MTRRVFKPTDTGVGIRQRVRFGRLVMPLAGWAYVCGVSDRVVANRMAQGDIVLDALRPTGARRVELSWELDHVVQDLVRENPEGMSLPAVGEHFGITRERVRQIQAAALQKLTRRGGTAWAEILKGVEAA